MHVLSGLQPTGKLHIGNYLGCIKPFLMLQNEDKFLSKKHIFLIADLHMLTKPEKIANARLQSLTTAKSLLALGVDLSRTTLIRQSKVYQHTSLAWILSCFTKYSRALNMIQFKVNIN